jgi:hypothetical protein
VDHGFQSFGHRRNESEDSPKNHKKESCDWILTIDEDGLLTIDLAWKSFGIRETKGAGLLGLSSLKIPTYEM